HALTMGFFGSTKLAMVARVACAQSGRTVVADSLLWSLFWVLQIAVVARVASELQTHLTLALLGLAALAWAGSMLTFALRYGRWFGRARVDGRPG
ncbi:MAG: NnrS family protein, partial [Burkholderiaceae bacterium]